MTKLDLNFLYQMIRKPAYHYFVENDLNEHDWLQCATGVSRDDFYKSIMLVEKHHKKVKD